MYIPDSIRIVARGQRVEVFSADNDTADMQSGDAIPTSSVRIYYDEIGGLSVQVTYGSSFRRVEQSVSKSITVTYDAEHIVLDIQRG